MTSLCISLGHNSSAVHIDALGIPTGYEEERLSRTKSDSEFPWLAIGEISKNLDEDVTKTATTVYISHWFDNFDPYETECKYYSAAAVKKAFPNAKLISTSQDKFTHHDAHAYSALAFYESSNNVIQRQTVGVIVVDGFGNGQEVASIYEQLPSGDLRLSHRVNGYDQSLGLMYQYAATACNMDGINDVYKFLGYRTQANQDDVDAARPVIDKLVKRLSKVYAAKTWNLQLSIPDASAPLIDYDALADARKYFEGQFKKLVSQDVFKSRVRVGYAVQEVLERIVIAYASRLNVSVVLAAGGCFYNVRLNDKLRKLNKGKTFCFMPIAGDQGAAIGMHRAMQPTGQKRIEFGNLCWGSRSVESSHFAEYFDKPDEAVDFVVRNVLAGKIVNLVRDRVEYGPRALCRTSSIAKCEDDLVDAINIANGRNTVMPMAPAMIRAAAYEFFDQSDLDRTKQSDAYMITAHDFTDSGFVSTLSGAMHKDVDGSYSGRPQIVTSHNDKLMHDVLTKLYNVGIKAVINTSLNTHGTPIIHTMSDLHNVDAVWSKKCPKDYVNVVVKES